MRSKSIIPAATVNFIERSTFAEQNGIKSLNFLGRWYNSAFALIELKKIRFFGSLEKSICPSTWGGRGLKTGKCHAVHDHNHRNETGMLKALTRLLMGDPNAKYLRNLRIDAEDINGLAEVIAELSDEDLRAKTQEFKRRLTDEGAQLDDLVIEACAVVREAAKRVTGLWAFDVQLMGAIALHEGRIAEMKTGEGKTLTAVFAAYVNALPGKGVHIVTINEYLAARDTKDMGPIFEFLGMRVGLVVPGMRQVFRKSAYAADVTYVTNNELCFDYLRDNMAISRRAMVLRGQNFAIVDEVDSVLIDEARAPIGISDKAPDDTLDMYRKVNALVPKIPDEAFEIDEKNRSLTLTDAGQRQVESVLAEAELLDDGTTIYDPANITFLHHIMMALRAHHLMDRDVHYLLRGTEVLVIDELSGRAMVGRRFGGGLHQALEAKESVPIQPETISIASVTYQNYFRLYDKLAGMTGTAATESAEFGEIYGLEIAEIPTNLPVARQDHDDEMYLTMDQKLAAIVTQIETCHDRKQPVLVGTTSVERSELVSKLLKQRKIKHQILNARHHDQEAQIIGQAGTPGAITIATNMAGRGTDIQLGGNFTMRVATELKNLPAGEKRDVAEAKIRTEVAAAKKQVIEAGGVFVLGTERHESRRVDNQLRGRCGRQGDPGESKYFLSLEDDLMRLFANNIEGLLRRVGMKDGESLSHPYMNSAVERAQKKIESRNFDQRKNVLRYDNVMNDQRLVMYAQRLEIMDADDVGNIVDEVMEQATLSIIEEYVPAGSFPNQWRTQELADRLKTDLALDLPISDWAAEAGIGDQEIVQRVLPALRTDRDGVRDKTNSAFIAAHGRNALIGGYDQQWREHCQRMDQLKSGIGLRALGQRDPLNEYKQEGLELFSLMLDLARRDAAKRLALEPVPLWDQLHRQRDQIEIQLARAKAQAEEQNIDPDLVVADAIVLAAFPEMQDVQPLSEEALAVRAQSLGRRQIVQQTPSAQDLPPWPQDQNLSKVRRNDPCPCGSGRKFKHCHGGIKMENNTSGE